MEIFGWILLLIFGLIVGLLIWIIFVPVYLKIDTRNNLYLISQSGTFLFSFSPVQKPHFRVEVFGFMMPDSKKPKKKPSRKPKRKPYFKKSIQTWIFLIKGILKSFKIQKLVGTADLDDVVLHSQLFAIYPLINQGPVQLTSNLNNTYYLNLLIEGRLDKMLYTFIIFLIKK
ncbi:hypothetical protein [Litoribacter populi]|uniref:hypothetical protein n=1 Tax=Litoribacter populi TaxID=2598460 RepID=UPI00117ED60C|nr:hypothetical protein [Litoribacter populi]